MYGGTVATVNRRSIESGLSPRVRGTDYSATTDARILGLSPRVRGTDHQRGAALFRGSIPACTGEPRDSVEYAEVVPVYPRVYGGTSHPCEVLASRDGLSPRVRGNLAQVDHLNFIQRSYPACTGEPTCRGDDLGVARGLSPRVRGTMPGLGRPHLVTGLSPRVRGNPEVFCGVVAERGSIPACTGEPYFSLYSFILASVYPRVYGGPVSMVTNRNLTSVYPACTGEPS